MSTVDLEDDPYLCDLLDLTTEEIKATASSKAGEEGGGGGGGGTGSAAAASSSPRRESILPSPSPRKPVATSSYRASDTHRETLKLLSQLSPSAVRLPSRQELLDAFHTCFPINDEEEGAEEKGAGEVDMKDVKAVQRALEHHLDVSDLSRFTDVIEEEMGRWRRSKEEKRRQQAVSKEKQEPQEETLPLSQDDASLSQGAGPGKKRKRATVPGGKAELPLVIPKHLAGSKAKSFLVELDERDKAQDLTGDSGAVGRVHVQKKKGVILDLKGHQYLAQLIRCPTLFLVSIGDEEAKVEDVVDKLCVLSHQRDHLETMGGKVIRGDEEDNGAANGSDEDFYYQDSDMDKAKPKKGGGAGKKKGALDGRKSAQPRKRANAAVKRKGGKGKAKKASGSAASAAKRKKVGPKKVSLKALNKGKKKDDDEDDDDDDFSEPDDPDDSDFSM